MYWVHHDGCCGWFIAVVVGGFGSSYKCCGAKYFTERVFLMRCRLFVCFCSVGKVLHTFGGGMKILLSL